MTSRWGFFFCNLILVFSPSEAASSRAPATQNKPAFLQLCESQLPRDEKAECSRLQNILFPQATPLQEADLGRIGLQALPQDQHFRVLILQNHLYMASFAYCYFKWQGWTHNLKAVEFSEKVIGLSILKSESIGYSEWLGSTEGQKCTQELQSFSQGKLSPFDLSHEMKNKKALLLLNPYAAISSRRFDEILRQLWLAANNGRITFLFEHCPAIKNSALELWENTPLEEKKKLVQQDPSFNWGDIALASRRYLASKFENNIPGILPVLASCPH